MSENHVTLKINELDYQIESDLSSPEEIVFWLEVAKSRIVKDYLKEEA